MSFKVPPTEKKHLEISVVSVNPRGPAKNLQNFLTCSPYRKDDQCSPQWVLEGIVAAVTNWFCCNPKPNNPILSGQFILNSFPSEKRHLERNFFVPHTTDISVTVLPLPECVPDRADSELFSIITSRWLCLSC